MCVNMYEIGKMRRKSIIPKYQMTLSNSRWSNNNNIVMMMMMMIIIITNSLCILTVYADELNRV